MECPGIVFVTEGLYSGDLEVKYDSTRLFAIFFIFACVLIYAVAFNNILDEWAQSIIDNDHRCVGSVSIAVSIGV
jgi:hypothetical protein